jgi:hypothetical protein
VAPNGRSGTDCFVKEHAIFLTDPISQSIYLLGNKNSSVKKGGLFPVRNYLRKLQLLLWTYADFKKRVSLPPQWQVQIPNPTVRSLSLSNKTVLSDSFLLTFRLTFLVRHSALVVPSYYRSHTDSYDKPKNQAEEHNLICELERWMTFHWMRWLYEFYCQQVSFQVQIHLGKLPIILDADDVVSSP